MRGFRFFLFPLGVAGLFLFCCFGVVFWVFCVFDGFFGVLSGLFGYWIATEGPRCCLRGFTRALLESGFEYVSDYEKRKLLSVEEMSLLINSVLEIRDKAIMTVFAKTGIRRGELIGIDVDDIDWSENYIKLKRMRKRSNPYVFFDEEAAFIIGRWLRVRSGYAAPDEKARFIGEQGKRIGRNIVYQLVTEHAGMLGLHDATSERLEDHFSPHCFRHGFTTHLRRNGMSREFIKELKETQEEKPSISMIILIMMN